MKRIIFAHLALAMLAFSSCHKSSTSASYPDGSWTFNSVTFPVTACIANDPTLTATDSLAGTPSCNIIIYFDSLLPVTSGTYTVVSQSIVPSANQVSIALGYVAPGVLNNYVSTGGNGTEKVSVTLSNGKLKISGSGIEMLNTGLGTDSAAVTFNITQTQ
jgi:hypothetical protein